MIPRRRINVCSPATMNKTMPTFPAATSVPGAITTPLSHQSTSRMMTTTPNTENFNQVQRPNRFTSIYNEMQDKCPNEIEIYANCVIAAQQQISTGTNSDATSTNNSTNNSGSTYHVCSAEFAAVKECFRTVRRRQRQETIIQTSK